MESIVQGMTHAMDAHSEQDHILLRAAKVHSMSSADHHRASKEASEQIDALQPVHCRNTLLTKQMLQTAPSSMWHVPKCESLRKLTGVDSCFGLPLLSLSEALTTVCRALPACDDLRPACLNAAGHTACLPRRAPPESTDVNFGQRVSSE